MLPRTTMNLPKETKKELDQIARFVGRSLGITLDRTSVVRFLARRMWRQINRGEITQEQIAGEDKA